MTSRVQGVRLSSPGYDLGVGVLASSQLRMGRQGPEPLKGSYTIFPPFASGHMDRTRPSSLPMTATGKEEPGTSGHAETN